MDNRGDDRMKDLMIEQYQNLNQKDNPYLNDMAEALEIIINATNDNLEPIQITMHELPTEKMIAITLNDKKNSLDANEKNGYIEIKNNRLEYQYFGNQQRDDMATIIIESYRDYPHLNAYITENNHTINMIENSILVNDNIIQTGVENDILFKAQMLGDIIQEYKEEYTSNKSI